MEEIMRFVHLLGAIAAGYYILLPIFAGRLNKLSSSAQEGYLNGLFIFNRVGQYIFILQLITGGYLISKDSYSVSWIIAVIVIFVVIAALAGMVSKPMKRLKDALLKNEGSEAHMARIKLFSYIIAIGFIALVAMMYQPW